MARPRKPGVQFHILLDPDLAERLERYVRSEQGATKTFILNQALRKYLDELEKNLWKGVDV